MAPVVAGLVGPVGEPVDLGGSGRSRVWRVPSGGASYVVKVHLEEGDAFGREAAALDALTGSGVGPDLVGLDAGRRLLVMEDLAPRHEEPDNLALALLGTDRPLARTRLDQWATAIGALHRASTPEVVGRFTERLAELAPGIGPEDLSGSIGIGVERYRAELPGLGLDPGDALEVLADVPHRLSSARVLSPTDACPDNNLAGEAGIRLLDFEGATLWHPAWDVAYLRVPFPSCWCAWALPPEEAERAERRYRDEVSLPEGFEHDLALTTLAWCVLSTGWFLPRALEPHDPDADDERIPPRRAMILHRLGLAASAEGPEELVSFARDLRARVVAEWGEQTLPLGPVWRSGR